MAGNKKFNTDLDITGKIKVTNVPNRAGTVMTYDTTSKEISTRTHSEIISDLGLITATNIAAAYYTKTQLQTSGQAQVNWGNLTNIPTTFTPANHSHTFSSITDKPATLSGYGITDAVTTNTFQEITGHKVFIAQGNSYLNSSIEVKGNGPSIVPGIGFHQPGVVQSYLYLDNDGYLNLKSENTGGSYNPIRVGGITANSYTKFGGTSTQVLMANGTVKELSTIGISSIPLATAISVGGSKLFSDTVQIVAATAVSKTAARTYGIQVNASGQMVVNVPWVDTNTVYTHPNSGVAAGTYKSVTVNAQGHVTAGTNPTTLAGYGITDAMSTSHAANAVTSTNISNWNTAFGWGNHATAGYLTSSALSPYAQTSWVNANFDKYTAWNLQTNNVQRTSMPSGSNLNLVAGANVTISYSAGGTVTISAVNTDTNTTYVAGDGISITGANNVITNTKPNIVQTLSGSGNTINLSNGGSYTIPAQTLSVSQSTQVNQINISGGNSINIENRFLGSFDGSRNPTDIKPNTSPKSIRADFAAAGTVGGTGKYAGVMTYAPWDGTTASTGDSSYQLAFINETGINGSGNPGLRLRKGIDTTWGSWISILTSVNGVTLDTTQTITGTKTFNNGVVATTFTKSGGTSTQVLMANGTVKELSTIGGSNYTAGSNISITGNAISVVNSPTFSGSVTAPAFYESSLKSLKKNIKTFDKSGLDLVNQLDIVTFDRKDESAKNKIGIIADDSPKEFLSEELDAVDLYKTVFIQAKAIQELKSEVDELKELVKQLLK